MCEVATYLKVGTTALMLLADRGRSVRSGAVRTRGPGQLRSSGLTRRHAAAQTLELANGRHVTALDLQWEYLDAVKSYLKSGRADEALDGAEWADEVVTRWEHVLNGLEADPSDAEPAGRLGREARPAARRTASATASSGTTRSLKLIDLQYHDVDPERGLYYRLAADDRVETARHRRRGPEAR